MIGAGTFINPLLKILTTVAILGAVYLFVIKPVLDTTEEVTRPFNETLRQSMRQIDEAVDQANAPFTQSEVRREVSGLSTAQARRLTNCIQRAGSNVNRFNACFDRYE
jgi:hypothetical protein